MSKHKSIGARIGYENFFLRTSRVDVEKEIINIGPVRAIIFIVALIDKRAYDLSIIDQFSCIFKGVDVPVSILSRIESIKSSTENPRIFDLYSMLHMLDVAVKEYRGSMEAEVNLFSLTHAFKLFEVLLTINDSVNKDDNIIHGALDDFDGWMQFILVKQLKERNVIKRNNRLLYTTQAVKFFMFIKYLNESKYKPLLDDFLHRHGFQSVKDYLSVLILLLQYGNHKTSPVFLLNKGSIEHEYCNYLCEYQRSSNYTRSFKYLKDKPILRFGDTTFRVLFFPFMLEKLYNSFYFELTKSEVSKDLVKTFKNDIGKEFSEDIVLRDILNKIFSKKHQKVLFETDYGNNVINKPDGYIRYNRNIFLIEMKDTLLNEELINSLSFKEIEEGLKQKFYQEQVNIKGKNRIKKKAVKQLVAQVLEFYSNNEFNRLDDKLDKSKATIYPILVLNNSQICVEGLNYLLNRWFVKEVELSGLQEKYHARKIRELTVLSIDTLLYYQDYLKASDSNLKNIILSYHKKLRKNDMSSMDTFEDHFHNYLVDRKLSTESSIFKTYRGLVESQL